MSNHKTLSPSGADRWMGCPGSIRMEQGYPDKSSPAADDGSKTHFLLEEWLNTGKPPLVGLEYDVNLGTDDEPNVVRFRHDADRHERLEFTTQYIYDRIIELDKEFGTDTVMKTEQFIESTAAFNRDDLGGTADVQLINGDFLEIVDLKDGMNPVDAEENNQMSIYAISILANLNDPKIKRVRLTIVQPKLRFNGESGISSWDISVHDLLAKTFDIAMAAATTDNPDAPLIPGDKQCKYCKARGACPALTSHVLEQSGVNFSAVDIVEQVVAVQEQPAISNDRLRDIILAAPLMRSMLDHLEQEALHRFQIGQPVEGLKVIRGRGSKSWKVTPEEVADKLGKMGVPKDKRWKQVIPTPGQAKSLIWTKKVKGEEVEAKLSPRQIKTLESEYIQESEGKLKVVSESAKGEPIKLAEEGMFKAVPELELPDFLK